MARVVVTGTMAAGFAAVGARRRQRIGYPYLHTAIDDSAACYTEALPDERG